MRARGIAMRQVTPQRGNARASGLAGRLGISAG
jgi:hypothetical protein